MEAVSIATPRNAATNGQPKFHGPGSRIAAADRFSAAANTVSLPLDLKSSILHSLSPANRLVDIQISNALGLTQLVTTAVEPELAAQQYEALLARLLRGIFCPLSEDRSSGMLAKLNAASSTRNAYEIAIEFLQLSEESDSEDVPVAIANYLRRSSSRHRAILLSCAADHDFYLNDDIRNAVVSLLGSSDGDLMRSAALALRFGGDESRAALSAHLEQLGSVRSNTVRHLLGLLGSTP